MADAVPVLLATRAIRRFLSADDPGQVSADGRAELLRIVEADIASARALMSARPCHQRALVEAAVTWATLYARRVRRAHEGRRFP